MLQQLLYTYCTMTQDEHGRTNDEDARTTKEEYEKERARTQVNPMNDTLNICFSHSWAIVKDDYSCVCPLARVFDNNINFHVSFNSFLSNFPLLPTYLESVTAIRCNKTNPALPSNSFGSFRENLCCCILLPIGSTLPYCPLCIKILKNIFEHVLRDNWDPLAFGRVVLLPNVYLS